MPVWKGRYTGVEEMKVAVMGCVVNGPGESKHANLGISLPGTFEEPKAPVYVDGRLFTTLKGDKIVAEFIQILDDYVESHYAAKEELAAKSLAITTNHVGTAALGCPVERCSTVVLLAPIAELRPRRTAEGGCPTRSGSFLKAHASSGRSGFAVSS